MEHTERVYASWEADRRLTVVETLLQEHLKQCDRRGVILCRLAYMAVSVNLTVLGVLLKIVLKL